MFYSATVSLDYRLIGSPSEFAAEFPDFAPGPVEPNVPVHAAGDSVTIHLTPRIFDAGWTFHGTVHGTEVEGTWCEHDFSHACTRRGIARLTRR